MLPHVNSAGGVLLVVLAVARVAGGAGDALSQTPGFQQRIISMRATAAAASSSPLPEQQQQNTQKQASEQLHRSSDQGGTRMDQLEQGLSLVCAHILAVAVAALIMWRMRSISQPPPEHTHPPLAIGASESGPAAPSISCFSGKAQRGGDGDEQLQGQDMQASVLQELQGSICMGRRTSSVPDISAMHQSAGPFIRLSQGGSTSACRSGSISQPLPKSGMLHPPPSAATKHWPSVASSLTRSRLLSSLPADLSALKQQQQQQQQPGAVPLRRHSALGALATAAATLHAPTHDAAAAAAVADHDASRGVGAATARVVTPPSTADSVASMGRGNSIGSSEASSSYQWNMLGCLNRAASTGDWLGYQGPKIGCMPKGVGCGGASCQKQSTVSHSLELLGLHGSLGCLSDDEEEGVCGKDKGEEDGTEFLSGATVIIGEGVLADAGRGFEHEQSGAADAGSLLPGGGGRGERGAEQVPHTAEAEAGGAAADDHEQQQLDDLAVLPQFDLEIGKELQFDEHHLLGFGSTGCVYAGQLALCPGVHVPVAVKMMSHASEAHRLLFNDARTQGQVDSVLLDFRREALILARSVHPNIVRCYGGSLRPPRPFIVQEHCEASLRDLVYDPYVSLHKLQQLCGYSIEGDSSRRSISLRDGIGRRLPMRRVLEITRDVAAGLAYLHPRVLHRDVRCANVLLAVDGTAKLADLGLSRVKHRRADAQHDVHDSQEVDNAAYAAPESFCMYASSRHASFKPTDKADVYSLGILLWELLSGSRPFHGVPPSILYVRVAVFGMRPQLPANASCWPEGLLPLLQACWAEEPGMRPSAEDVQCVLQAMLVGMERLEGEE